MTHALPPLRPPAQHLPRRSQPLAPGLLSLAPRATPPPKPRHAKMTRLGRFRLAQMTHALPPLRPPAQHPPRRSPRLAPGLLFPAPRATPPPKPPLAMQTTLGSVQLA